MLANFDSRACLKNRIIRAQLGDFSPLLNGSIERKSVKVVTLIYFFLQKNGLYVLVDHVPQYYGASATLNPQKTGPKREKLVLLSHFLLIKNHW